MLGGTGALLIVAGAIMLGLPLWITRRRRLQPLTPEDAPAALDAVRELASEQGIPAPRLLWNPLDASPGGLAFGHPGRYSVALTGGLLVKQATDPPAFRAILRHELAHIRNRDVGITYFTLAIWYAFLLVAVLPFALTLFNEGVRLDLQRHVETARARSARLPDPQRGPALTRGLRRRARVRFRRAGWGVAARAGGAPAAGCGVARTRAARSPRPDIAGLRRSTTPGRSSRSAPSSHSRPASPERSPTTASSRSCPRSSPTPSTCASSAALAYAPLVVGVVGVAVWREAFAALADGREPASPWVDGLALSAGLLIGPELALQRFVAVENTLLQDLTSLDGLSWAAVLVGGVTLLLAWIRTSASLVAPRAGRPPVARLARHSDYSSQPAR